MTRARLGLTGAWQPRDDPLPCRLSTRTFPSWWADRHVCALYWSAASIIVGVPVVVAFIFSEIAYAVIELVRRSSASAMLVTNGIRRSIFDWLPWPSRADDNGGCTMVTVCLRCWCAIDVRVAVRQSTSWPSSIFGALMALPADSSCATCAGNSAATAHARRQHNPSCHAARWWCLVASRACMFIWHLILMAITTRNDVKGTNDREKRGPWAGHWPYRDDDKMILMVRGFASEWACCWWYFAPWNGNLL